MWPMVGGEHSLKVLALYLLRFGMDTILKILNKKDDRINKSMKKTKVIWTDFLDLDLDFEDIFGICNVSVMVTFQFW